MFLVKTNFLLKISVQSIPSLNFRDEKDGSDLLVPWVKKEIKEETDLMV